MTQFIMQRGYSSKTLTEQSNSPTHVQTHSLHPPTDRIHATEIATS